MQRGGEVTERQRGLPRLPLGASSQEGGRSRRALLSILLCAAIDIARQSSLRPARGTARTSPAMGQVQLSGAGAGGRGTIGTGEPKLKPLHAALCCYVPPKKSSK